MRDRQLGASQAFTATHAHTADGSARGRPLSGRQRLRMNTSYGLQPIPLSDDPLLRVALAAHLARYAGRFRMHAESDLHIYLRWCAERDINPLIARRVDVGLFVGWLQEIRRFKPSTCPDGYRW
jgi:hypothetical protein